MQPEGQAAHDMDKQMAARKKSGVEWLAICQNALQALAIASFTVHFVLFGNDSLDEYFIGFFIVSLFNLLFFCFGPPKRRRLGLVLGIIAAILNFAQYSLVILLAAELQAMTDLFNSALQVFHHSTSADEEIAEILIGGLVNSAINFLALRKWWKALPPAAAIETPQS